jgi:hypothetical protein
MGVGIQFSTGVVASAGFEVYQNTPNPFKGETMISFNLPEEGVVSLLIGDALGRTVVVWHGNLPKGFNNKIVNVGSTGLSGMLYYTLTYKSTSITKRMLALE